jgi:FkbM family methyltransferase
LVVFGETVGPNLRRVVIDAAVRQRNNAGKPRQALLERPRTTGKVRIASGETPCTSLFTQPANFDNLPNRFQTSVRLVCRLPVCSPELSMRLFGNRRWLRNLPGFHLVRSDRLPRASLSGLFCRLVDQGFRPNHIVDVGANKGHWSRKAYRFFPDSGFTLIEPQEELKPQLEQFRRRCPTANLLLAGVSDEVGWMTLSVAPDTVSSGFLHTEEAARFRNWARREVPVVTLDHLVGTAIPCVPDMVKIDAEGMESRIIQGASTLIGKTELFLLEAPLINPPKGWKSFGEIVVMMAGLGYEPYEFTHFMRLPGRAVTCLLEVAFVRREGFLWKNKNTGPARRRAASTPAAQGLADVRQTDSRRAA